MVGQVYISSAWRCILSGWAAQVPADGKFLFYAFFDRERSTWDAYAMPLGENGLPAGMELRSWRPTPRRPWCRRWESNPHRLVREVGGDLFDARHPWLLSGPLSRSETNRHGGWLRSGGVYPTRFL